MDIDKSIEKITGQYSQDKYAMYLRKSRADLELEAMGEGETLAKHKKRLYDLAAKHGIHPDQIVIYQELVSGESIQDRPEMQRLLSSIYAKKYKGVLVVELERLARGNTKDQGEVADAFQYSHTHIITPVKVYDPDNEFDEEYFEFGLFMSRREYKTIRRRLNAGKEQSAKDGNYLLPQRTFGYNIIKPNKNDRTLEIIEEEAKIVQMMFDWFTEERKTIGWIARELMKMGISTALNRKEWPKQSVYDMLKNKTYIGLIEFGKYKSTKKIDPKTGKFTRCRVRVPDDEIIIAKGKHKAIISAEQFEKAQSLFNKQDQTPVRIGEKVVNPLAGVLVCAKCGRTMAWYSCAGKTTRYIHRGNTLCRIKSLPVKFVLDSVVEALQEYIADFEMKLKNDGNKEEMERHKETLEMMRSELAKQEKKKAGLFDSFEDGAYTRDEFISRKQIYTEKIETLKAQIQDMVKSAPEPVDYSEKIMSLHSVIDCINDQSIEGQTKNIFIKQFIDRITYDVIDYGQNKGGKPVLDVYLK